MMPGLYLHRDSPLHRLPAAIKLVVLAAAGLAIFFVSDPLWLAPALLAVIALYTVARVPLWAALVQLRWVLILLAVVFAVHGLMTSWTLGLAVVMRFAILLLLALLVTFTTRISDLIDVLERMVQPLRRIGINPAKVSLMISLALRFIPLLAEKFLEIREAQKARGLDRNLVAVVVPLLIKTLRMANDLTEAIEARGFDPDPMPVNRPIRGRHGRRGS